MKRRESLKPAAKKTDELPWDFFDRCLLPIIFSHAAAIVVSFVLNILRISQISSFSLFLIFVLVTICVTICYHNLQVSTPGKAVLITSCDNPIGYALARQLDDLGFTVYAGFTEKYKGSKLKDESSARLHILQLDVTSDSDIKNAYEYVHRNLPSGASGLWAIVNNTTWAAFGEFEWLPVDVYKRSMDVNVTSVIKISQLFLPSIRRTRGRIVNVSSITGRIPSELRSSLCTVKAAVEAFSECLRMELKKWGIDVIVVEPGSYTTGTWFDDQKILNDARDMWRRMSEDTRKHCSQDYFEFKVRSLPEYINAEKGVGFFYELSILIDSTAAKFMKLNKGWTLDNHSKDIMYSTSTTQRHEINVLPTVRSLTDAVYKTFPLSRYTPITKQEKLQTFVAEYLPSSVYRIIYS